MVSATDSATTSPVRWFRAGLALLTLMTEPGCARLHSFRQSDRPVFGTETASDHPPTAGRSNSGDYYAEHVAKPRDTARQSLAQNPGATSPGGDEAGNGGSAATQDLASRGEPKTDGAPLVALRPPTTLPALNAVNQGPTENRSGTSGWAEESKPAVASSGLRPGSQAAKPNEPTVASILAESRGRLDSLGSYRVKMNHQERVAGVLKPAEDVVLNIRRSPRAVRLEWREGAHKGREVIYAADANGGLMHVNTGTALVPRLSMPPDSPMATRNSRHPITEAGFDTILKNMEDVVQRQEAGDPALGRITYEGMETADGLDKPCHKIKRVTPTQETWLVYIDPESRLPALVQATDGNGDLLERYLFRDPSYNLADLAAADAFDPDARWGPSKGGLLQRLAKAGAAASKETETR